MDELVLRGMAKWPNVPAVHGWLALDRRGRWLIKGEPINHPAVRAFIGRNYERDAEGAWFFQNGPQRVFAILEYTPFVYRVVSDENAPLRLACHTEKAVRALSGAWIDESGSLLFESEHGIGLLHDRDLERLLPYFRDASGKPATDELLAQFAEASCHCREEPLLLEIYGRTLEVQSIESSAVPQRFGFVANPQAREAS